MNAFDKGLIKKRTNVNIIRQAKLCDDYIACKSQMEKPFGVVPLSPPTTYVGAPTNNDCHTDPLLMHQLVCKYSCPTFLGLQIPVISNLNIPSCRAYLKQYWDQQLVHLLKFGFSLDFDRDSDLVSTEENHSCYCIY